MSLFIRLSPGGNRLTVSPAGDHDERVFMLDLYPPVATVDTLHRSGEVFGSNANLGHGRLG
ncbi:MAG TPA: hypothetical protein PLC06_10735 [Promineifilum sp.]|nr:hypothetical protein [Promineifilum sp.]